MVALWTALSVGLSFGRATTLVQTKISHLRHGLAQNFETFMVPG